MSEFVFNINTSQLTLGELYDKLCALNKEQPVTIGNGLYVDGFDSYRGDYYQGQLTYTFQENNKTVGDVLKILDDALDRGYMTGYKGGEFDVDDNISMNMAMYGCTGQHIVDVIVVDDVVNIVGKEYH